MQEQEQSVAARVRVLRIIWAALLLGQLIFLVVTMAVANEPDGANISQLLLYIAIGLLITVVPMAYVMRGIIYRSGRKDGVLSPSAYVTGNIIFLAMCEGVGMLAIVGAFLNGGRGPHLIVAAIAMAVQVVNFPTGAPLHQGDTIQPIHRR